MIALAAYIILAILLLLTVTVIIFVDVYNIQKMPTDIDTDINDINFSGYVIPAKYTEKEEK